MIVQCERIFTVDQRTYRRQVRAMIVVELAPWGEGRHVAVIVNRFFEIRAAPHEHPHGDSTVIVLVVVVSRVVVVVVVGVVERFGKGASVRRLLRMLPLLRQMVSVGRRCRRNADGGPGQRPTLRGGAHHDKD
jgi:hypothetical protein